MESSEHSGWAKFLSFAEKHQLIVSIWREGQPDDTYLSGTILKITQTHVHLAVLDDHGRDSGTTLIRIPEIEGIQIGGENEKNLAMLHEQEKGGKDDFWFWCVISQITMKKKPSSSQVGEVWENLMLINAPDPNAAYEKALKIGEELNGDCDGSLRLDGYPANAVFLGVKDMGLVDEDIGDGCEILFVSKRQTLRKAKAAISGRELLPGIQEIVDRKRRVRALVRGQGKQQ